MPPVVGEDLDQELLLPREAPRYGPLQHGPHLALLLGLLEHAGNFRHPWDQYLSDFQHNRQLQDLNIWPNFPLDVNLHALQPKILL